MKFVFIVFLGIFIISGSYWYSRNQMKTQNQKSNSLSIRYIAVGDSYTEGLGVSKSNAWPKVLTDHIRTEGIDFVLVKNLGVTGYTASDVIKYQLPEFEQLNPDIATLLIGANDISLGISDEEFHNNLTTILQRMQNMPPPKRSILIPKKR